MSQDREALAAARAYLRGLGAYPSQYPVTYTKTDSSRGRTTWDEVLRDYARALRETGLVARHLDGRSRFARKRAAYREQSSGSTPHIRTKAQVKWGEK